MSNSGRSNLLIVLALLIGISGVGLGAYSTFFQTPITENNEEDFQIYYCSSEEEINDALIDIGSGSGTITITDNIILTSSIIINGSGSYIIQGIAPNITLDCNGDQNAIRIEITQSCIIRDLTIDATDITSNNMNIIFVSDTFSYIQNVKIFGDAGRNGRGIYIDCADVWVSNCYITETLYGIFGASSAHSTHVSDNTVLYCDDGGQGEGILLYGDSSTCDNNYVAYCHIGIYVLGYQCTVSNNVLYGNNPYAIRVATDYSTFSGNSIRGLDPDSLYTLYGIYVYTGSDFNVFTGNLIYNYSNVGDGIGYGVRVSTSSCVENTIVGNTFLSCETPISDSGTNTFIANNNIV